MSFFSRVLNFIIRVIAPPLIMFLLILKTGKDGNEQIALLFITWIPFTQLLKYTLFPSKNVYEARIKKRQEKDREIEMVRSYRKKKKSETN